MNEPRPIHPAPAATTAATERRHGFTLIELMISIALVLLLVVGINVVFRTTADTVGGGQAALTTARELRTAFDTLDSDFSGFVGIDRQPLLLIGNQNVPGFRDKADEKSDPFYSQTNTDPTSANESALKVSDGKGGFYATPRVGGIGTVNSPSLLTDNRNHRVDILSFFSEGHFRRQTGAQTGNPVYQSGYTSDAAYIWYGHGRLPPNSANDAS